MTTHTRGGSPFLAGLGFVLAMTWGGAAALAQGEASIWSSAVDDYPFYLDLIPVGGSGQVNGGFVLDTYFDPTANTALQVGLRGQERYAGLLPQEGTVYFATTGTSGGGSGATWNYDFHLDFGTLEEDAFPANDIDAMPGLASLEKNLRLAGLLGVVDELTPLNMRDFDVEFFLDLDPSGGTDFVVTDMNAVVDAIAAAAMVSSPDMRLFQNSLNMLFNVFGGGSGVFDPDIQGLYDFRLTVTDPGTQTVLAQSAIQVAVGYPSTDTTDIQVTTVESADPVVVDDTAVHLTYTVVLTNNDATVAAADVEVSETLVLPAGTSLGSSMASAGSVSGTPPNLTWTVGSLAAAASETLTLVVSVDPSATDAVTSSAVAVTSTPDQNVYNNSSSAATSVACLDSDGDTVCDRDDNCPANANSGQTDTDGDAVGDVCDLCTGDDAFGDVDNDGLCEDIDVCFGTDATGDADMDGLCADRDCDESDPLNVCEIFSDGFESGDVLIWSASTP